MLLLPLVVAVCFIFLSLPRSTIAVASAAAVAVAHFVCFPFHAAGDTLFLRNSNTEARARARANERPSDRRNFHSDYSVSTLSLCANGEFMHKTRCELKIKY